MSDSLNWRLPEGVEDLLPPAAWALEQVRRRVLDIFHRAGFDYIEPPVIEYLDALLVGSGGDLDLQTLKVVDQRSGRLLGVRADLTSQAARIDAHSLPDAGVRRLCYAGTVVHANPAGVLESRIPEKAGAEIFGAPSLAADAEVITLLLDVLHAAGLAHPVLVLGHVGIYQHLVAPLGLPADRERQLFAAVQSKSQTDIAQLLDAYPGAAGIIALPTLMGRRAVLAKARDALADAPAEVLRALDSLSELADSVAARVPGVDLRFDLAELAGYGYHNGPVFTAYQGERGNARARGTAIARGGRYDGIGAAFGRARPATGFDINLKQLLAADALAGDAVPERAVWVPWSSNTAEGLQADERSARIRALRAAGEIVIVALAADETAPARCDRVLVHRADGWSVEPRN
ncbi:MAG: phosphoribosyltransferase regulatory subunit [Pseudomonadota bacterium]